LKILNILKCAFSNYAEQRCVGIRHVRQMSLVNIDYPHFRSSSSYLDFSDSIHNHVGGHSPRTKRPTSYSLYNHAEYQRIWTVCSGG